MIRDYFRVLVVDLASGKGKVANVPGREEVGGGSGLGALLFTDYGKADRPWDDPEQPADFRHWTSHRLLSPDEQDGGGL